MAREIRPADRIRVSRDAVEVLRGMHNEHLNQKKQRDVRPPGSGNFEASSVAWLLDVVSPE